MISYFRNMKKIIGLIALAVLQLAVYDVSADADAQILINGKEDAADNFGRGHYTIGKTIID